MRTVGMRQMRRKGSGHGRGEEAGQRMQEGEGGERRAMRR
jgi:hypothetical protein